MTAILMLVSVKPFELNMAPTLIITSDLAS